MWKIFSRSGIESRSLAFLANILNFLDYRGFSNILHNNWHMKKQQDDVSKQYNILYCLFTSTKEILFLHMPIITKNISIKIRTRIIQAFKIQLDHLRLWFLSFLCFVNEADYHITILRQIALKKQKMTIEIFVILLARREF